MVLILSLVLTISYYFVNQYYDRKKEKEDLAHPDHHENKPAKEKEPAPTIYALLPLMPLFLLLAFSSFFNYLPFPINIDTNIAMLAGLFIALIFEGFRTKQLAKVLKSLDVFWAGMGDIFKSVITLIVAADIFSKGLISLGFIDALVSASSTMGLGGMGIGIVMTIMIFMASMLMGSGNAAFFAFGPLVPAIALPLGYPAVEMILPMSLAASMGRAVSPIAGMLVAAATLAKIQPIDVVKRNLIPFTLAMAVMITIKLIGL